MKADAESKERENAIDDGLLVTIQDAEAKWTDIALTTKARIMAIAPRLAPELVGETSRTMIQAKIEKSLKEALSQLAKTGPNGNSSDTSISPE